MSVDITVAPLAGIDEDYAESPLFYDHCLLMFDTANAWLRRNGLAEHHEPRAVPDSPGLHHSAKWALPELGEVVDDLEDETAERFDQIARCAFPGSLFLPVLFPEPVRLELPDESVKLGSAPLLLAECGRLAHLLGLDGSLVLDGVFDHLPAAEHARFTRPLPTPPDGLRTLPEDRSSPWPPGADGCAKLLWAVQSALGHTASIYIH